MEEYELIGVIKLFAGNFAPKGWAFCKGQLLPIAQNTALFSVIETTYGGDGINTFALPDLRGRVPVGAGPGPGLSPRIPGQIGGTETVTLLPNQLPAHTHPLLASTALADEFDPTGAALAQMIDIGGAPTTAIYTKSPATAPMAARTGAVGGSQPHDNMAPFLGLNYIICLQGLYPSRA